MAKITLEDEGSIVEVEVAPERLYEVSQMLASLLSMLRELRRMEVFGRVSYNLPKQGKH